MSFLQEILWDSSQWQRLLLTYLLLTLPFFFVANAIALTMMRFHQQIPLVYGIDLIGAGIGAVSVMGLLQIFSAETLLSVLAIGGLTAGLFALSNLNNKQKRISRYINTRTRSWRLHRDLHFAKNKRKKGLCKI